MSAFADFSGSNGMVTIDSKIIIRQGNGVNYSFTNDIKISKLEIKQTNIKIGTFIIECNISSGYLSNTISNLDRTLISWNTITSNNATVNYTFYGLRHNTNYTLKCDGIIIKNNDTTDNGNFTFERKGNHSYMLYYNWSRNYAPIFIALMILLIMSAIIITIVIIITNDKRKYGTGRFGKWLP